MKENLAMDAILASTREIALNELAPRAQEIDKSGNWPVQSIRALQNAGLGGACASTSMCFGMHLVGSAVLSAKATTEQQEKFLFPIAEGKHITTLALSEPGTGSHFYIPEAKLTKKENGDYILNGTKSFVTNGGHADSYVVSVVIPDPGTITGQFSCVAIPNQSDGIEWKKPWKGIGMKGNSSREVELKDLHLPAANLLGEQGDQIWFIFEVVTPYFLTAMAGTYLGIASAALDEAIEHLKARTYTHSGVSLSHQPVLQHRLGELWAQVESARQFLYNSARKSEKGEADSLLSLFSAKAEVSDCVVRVVNEVMTLMGGITYAIDGKLARHLRDARASHVMAPTTDLLRTWTGRSLLNVPLLGD